MIAGFDWWLLLVGIVGGAGIVWLVVADFRRRDEDVAADERAEEASWIAEAITEVGRPIDDATVDDVLRLHRAYLEAPPPDLDPVGQWPLETTDLETTDLETTGRRRSALDASPVEGDGSQR